MTVRIGMMSFAHMHANSFAACVKALEGSGKAKLVGVADDDETRGSEAARRLEVQWHSSYESLLSAGLDAVIICSENSRHRVLTEMAAAAGKHVLCEKPLAVSVADGEAMIAACERASVQLMVCFPCRFAPAYEMLRSTVSSGEIGRVIAIAGRNRGKNPGGWFTDLAQAGGGAVMDHVVHLIDLWRDLLQCEPERVYAEISNAFFGAEYDDAGIISIDFENGVFATLDPSWSRGVAYPTWGDVTMRVVGEHGTVAADLFGQTFIHCDDRAGRIRQPLWGDAGTPRLIGAYVESLRNGTRVPVTGADGLAATRVALAAYESARKQMPVTIPVV